MGTYLITGATGGIGTAIAEALATRGHELILVGSSPERLAGLVADLGSGAAARTATFDPKAPAAGSPPPPRTLVLDLTEPRRIEAALAEVSLPERLDGVVHSAGVVELGTVADLHADDWIDQIMVNLVSAAELTRLLLPALRAAHGHVVFINSGSGLHAHPNWSAYAASKHGLRALADSLRGEEPELAVTSVYPGRTATEMQRKVRAQESAAYEPGSFIDPRTVGRVVLNTLETPRDSVVTDVTIRR